jgi:hypothetical protein
MPFSSMKVAPFKQKELWGFIHLNGSMLFKPQYSDINKFPNQYYAVFYRENVGLVDKAGSLIVKPECVEIIFISHKLFAIKKDNAFQIIDDNAYALSEPIYADLGQLSNGLIPFKFKTGYGYGYMDSLFNAKIRPKFQLANNFSNGYAAVMVNMKWGIIDIYGKIVAKPKYDTVFSINNHIATAVLNGEIEDIFLSNTLKR